MTILAKLQEKFAWLEAASLRVGCLYLHPDQVAELQKHPETFDRHLGKFDPHLNSDQAPLAGLAGYLWGAFVCESVIVPENHVCLVQDGLEAKLVDSAACMPL